jgi:LAO/AO transport system kinase
MVLSALSGDGLSAFRTRIERFHADRGASGALAARRRAQERAWLWDRIDAGLRQRFRADAAVRAALPALEADVIEGRTAAGVAARRLLDLFH